MALTLIAVALVIGIVVYVILSLFQPRDEDLEKRNSARRETHRRERRQMRSVWQRAGHAYHGDEYSAAGKAFALIVGIALGFVGLILFANGGGAGGVFLFLPLVLWWTWTKDGMNW
jgi:hypothetical protein